MPDLLVVCVDANCRGQSAAKDQIISSLGNLASRAAIACPDPHIERWYMADPVYFEQIVGRRPKLGRKKCERGRYKKILAKTVMDAGQPATLGGLEFAEDLARGMDFYRAGKTDKALRAFATDFKSLLLAHEVA
jgi:hypothetical protein